MPLTRNALLEFLRSRRYAVQSSVHPNGAPQSAVVGIAVSDDFEIVFDTLGSSRKGTNLARNPGIAFVIGGWTEGDERTAQYEGRAELPTGDRLDSARDLYFRTFPDGRDRLSWPGLVHVLVQPTWIRYSDYTPDPPEIVAWTAAQLREMT